MTDVYWTAVMYTVWGTDIFPFETEEDARSFAETEYEKKEVYGYRIKKESE